METDEDELRVKVSRTFFWVPGNSQGGDDGEGGGLIIGIGEGSQ